MIFRNYLSKEYMVSCPKCFSTQLIANKKGFSGRKAVGGAILTGGIGLLAGTLGSNKVILTCLSCGHRFRPGQGKTSSNKIKNYTEPQKIINRSKPKDVFRKPPLTNGQLKKKILKWFGIILISFIGLGLLGDLLEKFGLIDPYKQKEVSSTQTIIKQPLDTIVINKELSILLAKINKINIDPRKSVNQFSKVANRESNYSNSIYQYFESAKSAKRKMEIANSEIENIIIPKMLPKQQKDSLTTALSLISSSYLTLSGGFMSVMNLAKYPSDASYAETFRDEMKQGTEMYGEALSAILIIYNSYRPKTNKRRH